MNILICGNINNYPLLLAKGFIEIGHKTNLILFKTKVLDRPESKYPDYTHQLPDWIIDLSGAKKNPYTNLPDLKTLSSSVNPLGKIDLVILNDRMIAFAKYFKCPKVIFATGSDLTMYANYRLVDFAKFAYSASNNLLAVHDYLKSMSEFVFDQRFGFFSADLVCYAAPGIDPQGDLMLKELGVHNSNRLMPYMSDVLSKNVIPLPDNKCLRILNDLVLFSLLIPAALLL